MQGTQPLRFLPHSGGSGGFTSGSDEGPAAESLSEQGHPCPAQGGHIPLSDAGGRREKREERGTG